VDENGILLLGGGISIGTGLILLAVGAIPVIVTLHFLRTAVETTGTIVELRVAPGDGIAFQAVVDFKTHEGETIRWTQFGWRSRFPGNVGEEIPMKYNPQNPHRARTADAVFMWVFGGILSSMGLLLCGIGVWLILNMQ